MTMEKTVYKVVLETSPSQLLSITGSRYALNYYMDREIKPVIPHSKIFCFKELADVRDFFRQNNLNFSGYIILEGIGKNPKGLKKCCCWLIDYENFWLMKKRKKRLLANYQSPPKGTVVVDSFIPQRVIFGE